MDEENFWEFLLYMFTVLINEYDEINEEGNEINE
jgi:hypothetical protein